LVTEGLCDARLHHWVTIFAMPLQNGGGGLRGRSHCMDRLGCQVSNERLVVLKQRKHGREGLMGRRAELRELVQRVLARRSILNHHGEGSRWRGVLFGPFDGSTGKGR